ncbi:hypothetical protein DPMN_182744 [Dreissena polymorpha]|uniref:Zinc finger PHD-type domain-containing protein n=1 Tax=Dreissena polymorpha TaxID=45954 RepID=A0A9D4DGA0_DREPO|nr:hypothetical protein DPMN_182744 [Dreissena polymorpha]
MKGSSAANPMKGKGPLKGKGCLKRKVENVVPQEETTRSSMSKDFCKACLTTWVEDITSGENQLWIQFDQCDGWVHAGCLTERVDADEPFTCPDCV